MQSYLLVSQLIQLTHCFHVGELVKLPEFHSGFNTYSMAGTPRDQA